MCVKDEFFLIIIECVFNFIMSIIVIVYKDALIIINFEVKEYFKGKKKSVWIKSPYMENFVYNTLFFLCFQFWLTWDSVSGF